MSHNPVGFAGSVGQSEFSKFMALTGPRFKVAGAADWKPTVAGGDLNVTVASGTGYAAGVMDPTNAPETVVFDSNATGVDRFDLLIVTFTWTPGDGGTVAFGVVKGTAGAGVPAESELTRNPGLLYHGVIAVVRVRSGALLTTGDVTDMRPQGGRGGPLIVADGTYLQYIDADVGQLVYETARRLTFEFNGVGWGTRFYSPAFPAWMQSTIRVSRDSTGLVFLAGRILQTMLKPEGATAAPVVLPPEYRPAAKTQFSGISTSTLAGTSEVYGTITPDGVLSLPVRSGTSIGFGDQPFPYHATYGTLWPAA